MLSDPISADAVIQIVNAITNLGFPVICCIMLWKFISTTMKENTKAMQDNTKAIEELSKRVERNHGRKM